MISSTPQLQLTDGVSSNQVFAHGLSQPPSYCAMWLLCTNDDAASGLVAGQLIQAAPVWSVVQSCTEFIVITDNVNITIGYLGDLGSLTYIPGNPVNVSSWSNFSLFAYFSK